MPFQLRRLYCTITELKLHDYGDKIAVSKSITEIVLHNYGDCIARSYAVLCNYGDNIATHWNIILLLWSAY